MTNETGLYVDRFITERPRNGIDSPHLRLVSALKLNDELADYFRDRAQIEDIYAKSIAKLTRKTYVSNKSSLGLFLPLWEMLQLELSRTAAIHTDYSNSIIENIEQPLRSCIPSSKDFQDIQRMEEHMHKIAREYDEFDIKIQKHKKSAKGESKAMECMKQQEMKFAEWKQLAPEYLHKHQLVDENRWNTIKFTTEIFESLQQSYANKIIEMTTNTLTAAEQIKVDDEIAAFCASSTQQNSIPESHQHDLLSIENIVPEPSISDSSLKHPPSSVKKEKKRFFQSLVSMRRKPKSDTGHVPMEQHTGGGRQRSFSNAGSFAESLHSIHTHSTVDHNEMTKSNSSNNFGIDLSTAPGSPNSMNPPSLRKATSFNGSITSALSSQPAPLIVVDGEGFSIPPSDRTAWPLDAITTKPESLLDLDDMGSDGGSIFSSNPRIRVDIKSEAVSEEDASQSAVALTRVVTLLKEKNTSNGPTTRRLRGRREMRATQLYSVVEGDQTLGKVEDQSSFINPFESSQEKIVEEPTVSEETPQMHVQINETVHVLAKGEEAERSVIWGEISIQYEGPIESATPICFQMNHATEFEKIETTDYVEMMQGYEQDTFKMHVGLFNPGEYNVCIKYQAKLANHQLPLIVKPMWKCESDKSRLLVKYHKQSDLPPLENVVFVTSITGNVQNALSIPAGELILSQKRIKWEIGQISDDAEAVIKAQFITLEQATPQPIAIRFDLKNHLMTDLCVDKGNDNLILWAKVLTTSKSVKVGKYIAEVY